MNQITAIIEFSGYNLVAEVKGPKISFKIPDRDISKLKEKVYSAIMEQRKVMREMGLKIPEILNSTFEVNFFIKDFMEGGKREVKDVADPKKVIKINATGIGQNREGWKGRKEANKKA